MCNPLCAVAEATGTLESLAPGVERSFESDAQGAYYTHASSWNQSPAGPIFGLNTLGGSIGVSAKDGGLTRVQRRTL
jgi:hypothetical protein